MHQTINPAILYFGTPVVLIRMLNENGTSNLAPMSSAWWSAIAGNLVARRTSKRAFGTARRSLSRKTMSPRSDR